MDLEPAMRFAVTELRDALRGYANSKNWKPSNYRILMTAQPKWGALMVVLFSDQFQRGKFDEKEVYSEIMNHLRVQLREFTGLFEAISLLVRPLDEYYTWGYQSRHEDIIEISDAFLNPELEAKDLVGPIASRM